MVKKSPECTAGGYGQCEPRADAGAGGGCHRTGLGGPKRAVAAVACVFGVSKHVPGATFQTAIEK